MITYETDELKKTDRKSNALGKKAKNTEVKKGRNAKIYTMNIERKRILKQRREQTLQNVQGRKLGEEYFLKALTASHKTPRALIIHKRAKQKTLGQ